MKITIDIENKTIYIDGNYTFLELEKLMNESLKDFQEYKMEYVSLPYVPIIPPYIPLWPPPYPNHPPYWITYDTCTNNDYKPMEDLELGVLNHTAKRLLSDKPTTLRNKYD